MSGGIFEGVGMKVDEDLCDLAEAKKVVHIYCQTKDGAVYEVKFDEDSHNHRITANIYLEKAKEELFDRPSLKPSDFLITEKSPGGCFTRYKKLEGGLSNTDVTILPFDSVKALEEIVVSNPDDFLEKIIDKSNFMFTELGAKIIRNIRPNEEHVNSLYKSLKAIEKRAECFDPSKLLGYSDVDGDPATIVSSVLKESIKGSMKEQTFSDVFLSGLVNRDLTNKVPKNLKTLMDNIFKGYTIDYPGDAGKIKERILKIISFFVEFADVLSNQQ